MRASGTLVVVTAAGEGGIDLLCGEARRRGLDSALLTGPLTEEAARRLSALADRLAMVEDVHDPEALAEAARGLAGGAAPAAVVSFSDGAIVPAARAAELLGIARTSAEAFATARDKYQARQVLRAAGLASPPFALIEDVCDAHRVAGLVGLPAIVKPVSGTASLLVRRVETVAELETAYRLLADRMPLATGRLGSGMARAFLVEGLLHGREYCVDVVVRAGVIEHAPLLDKFLVDGRFFERGFAWPPLDLDAERQRAVLAVVDQAVAALYIDNTTAHVEVMDDPDLGPTVVEVNPGRPGGQIVGLLTVLAKGIDLCAEHVALALGEPPPERARPRREPPLATLSFFPEHPGRLVAVHGIDEVAEHPAAVSIQVLSDPGDLISGEFETFPVNVLIGGLGTREELLRAYDEIAALIRIEVEPLD